MANNSWSLPFSLHFRSSLPRRWSSSSAIPFISFYFGLFKFLWLLFCVPLTAHMKLLCCKSNNFWISNFNYTTLVLESYACHLLTKRFYVLLLYKITVNPKRYTGIDRYPKYIVPVVKLVQLPVRYWLPWFYPKKE